MKLVKRIKKAAKQLAGRIQSRGKIKKILARSGHPVKLHIGSGRNYKEGWVNMDVDPDTKKDVLCDVAKGIPFPDNSVDFIYNEHFIEHLSYDDGFAFMNEAYRVLRPGGVLRIACPDLDFLVQGYLKDDWRSHEWVRLINACWYPSRCYMLNQNMREDGGHQYLYDQADLAARLNEAGFFSHHIRAEQMNRSAHQELQNIDRRRDSLIVEARKERSFPNSPLLTVIVSARNLETSIAKTLDSILEQKTRFDFIIKVAEGSSTDGTQKILLAYQEKHPKIIKLFLKGKRIGVEKNRHQVLKTIDTKYFTILEGEDYWCDRDKLQMQVDELEGNPAGMVCGHNTLFHNLTTGQKSHFIGDIVHYQIKGQNSAKEPFATHPSSRVYRNSVDFATLPSGMTLDAAMYPLFLSKGNLLYVDKVMSVHNI